VGNSFSFGYSMQDVEAVVLIRFILHDRIAEAVGDLALVKSCHKSLETHDVAYFFSYYCLYIAV
jgi:hypothetical protein